MIKASISMQDPRRILYVKGKAETSWRFWAQNREGFRLEAVE